MSDTQSAPLSDTEPGSEVKPYEVLDTFGGELGYSIHELATATIPPAPWLVEDVLPKGLSVLAGRSKGGKSYLCLGLAHSVATGKRALDRYEVKAQGEVLYLMLDDPKPEVMARARKLTETAGVPLAVYLQASRQEVDGEWPELVTWLLRHPDCRLVIVDVWAAIKPLDLTGRGPGREGYLSDYNVVLPLKRIAQDYDIALLLVTHSTKLVTHEWQDRIMGSVGIAAAADSLFLLHTPPQQPGKAELKGRGKSFSEINVALEQSSTGLWRATGGRALLGPAESTVYSILKSSLVPLMPAALATMSKLPEHTVRWAVRSLSGKGLAERIDGGYVALIPAGPNDTD